MLLLLSADFFSKLNFQKSLFRDTVTVSNDLGPNCLQLQKTTTVDRDNCSVLNS